MAYDRYESRRGWREPRGRFSDDFRDRDERGFFERAGDEVASWFGDDEAERRRTEDARRFDEEGGRRPRTFPSDEDFSRFDRQPRFRDEGYRRPYTGRFFGRRGFGEDQDRGFGSDRSWSQDRWTPERQRDCLANAGPCAGDDRHFPVGVHTFVSMIGTLQVRQGQGMHLLC